MKDNYCEKTYGGTISNELLASRTLFLGKWIRSLFLVTISYIIVGIVANGYVMRVAPGVYKIGLVLNGILYVASGVILIKLSSEEKRYRIAGICVLISSIANILVETIFSTVDLWSVIIMVPLTIVGLLRTYYEYNAHSIVLRDVDHVLSEKWIVLWKWEVGCLLVLFASLILMMVNPILGGLVSIGAEIGIIFTSILQLVYLYRTAKVFREYRSDAF